jgi:hypothetical protein
MHDLRTEERGHLGVLLGVRQKIRGAEIMSIEKMKRRRTNPPSKKKYPSSMRDHEMIEYVAELHYRPEDVYEGDLRDRIEQFTRYDLQELDTANLHIEWGINRGLVDDIKDEMIASNFAYPPIVYDPVHNSIIDGTHRFAALQELGKTKVWAYIGSDYIGEE